MGRTIVIGIGGTGLQVIRAMRRQLVEKDSAVDLDKLESLAFLYLDTTAADITDNDDNRERWEVMGKSTMLRQSEYLIFQMGELGRVVEDIDAYPNVAAWLPVDQLRGKISSGDRGMDAAQQIRPLGRLAFAMNQKYVESAFRSALNSLRGDPGAQTKIHIVGSLSGGTGSGMFLDVAYSAGEWAGDDAIRIGYLVFPSLDVDRGPRYLPNAYAALMELNYYNLVTLPPGSEQLKSRGGTGRAAQPQPIGFRRADGRLFSNAPFTFSYLVSPKNQANARLSLDSVAEMIAQRITLELDNSFADVAQFLTENGRANMSYVLVDPYRNDRAFSQRFKTFGFSYVKYPVVEISELLAYRIAGQMFQGWTAEREIPGNITERVAPLMHELRMTDAYLLGDKDIFAVNPDFEGYEEAVNRFVNQTLGAVPATNIEAALRQKPAAFEAEFRGTGALQFYQTKSQDIAGAVAEITKLTRRKVSDMIVDPALGPDYASRVLEEVVRSLERRRKQFVDSLSGFAAKEKNTLASLEDFYHKLTEAERKLLFRDKAVREALTWVGDAMKAFLKVRISARAYGFAVSLLNALIESRGGIKGVQQELHDWERAVTRVTDSVQQEIDSRSAYLSRRNSETDQNGTVLYDGARVADLYTSLDVRGSAIPFVRDALLAKSGGVALDFNVTPAARAGALPSVVEDAYRAAIEWLVSRSTVRIHDKNVADKLIEDYPDVNVRRALLLNAFKRSAPFLSFSQGEIGAHQSEADVAYQQETNTFSCAIGVLSEEDGALPNVRAIRNELRNFKSESAKEPQLAPTANRNEILFLQEWTAFPLRIIADLRTLRERYQEARRSPLPLHIQKSFEPGLCDLFMTSRQEVRDADDVEDAFFVARALNVLRSVENQRELRSEIRYFYRDAGLEVFAVLGTNWDEAFAALSRDANAAIRERLLNDVNDRVRRLETGTERVAFVSELLRFVTDLKAACRYGEDDPEYLRWRDVYKRVIATQKLTEFAERAAVARPAETTTPA